MDINVLKTFVAVCEYSGFSAAAERLGYAQPTVSTQIRQLEKELKTTLFDRYYHRVELTADGELVLRYARDILALDEQLEAALRAPEEIEGVIRLAMSSSVCVRYFRDDFLRFREKYPGIRLVITEAGTETMFDMLRKNEADLVFTLDARICEPDFEICAEHPEYAHFVVGSGHPFAKRIDLTLEELLDAPFTLTEPGMSYRRQLDQKLAERDRIISPVLEVGSPLQICSLLEAGTLVSFLPDFITEEQVRKGTLTRLEIPECTVAVQTQLLLHRNKWKSPAINAFIDYYRRVIDG